MSAERWTGWRMRHLKLAMLAAGAALLAAAPAGATWRRAESSNFILYSQSGEAKVREQAALLEDYHQFLRILTGVSDPPAPNKLRVYLVRGRDQLRVVRDVPTGVVGFYTATPSGIAAFADDRSGGWGEGDEEILFHEIAHHFMWQYRPSAYPAWFVEGFAEYAMTARFKPKTIEFGQPSMNRAGWLRNARWLPFEQVLFEAPPKRPQESALYYAQSWLLAHYLMRDNGRREQFKAYLKAIATGTAPREAFKQQFGEMKAFERAIESYAGRHVTFTRVTRSSAAVPPAVTIETLPASADDLLLSDAAMHVGVHDDYAPPLLARVRNQAAKHPADAYAKRVLARAEVLHGDASKGDALLDELLRSNAADAELLYLKGMRHLQAGRTDEAGEAKHLKQAQIWFARAHKADKYHFPTLARYAESLRTDARFNSDNTMEIMLLARELAPQVEELTMNAANLLLLRGKFEEAEAILRPLASNPHDQRLAAAAQALADLARAKGKAQSPKPAGTAAE